MRDNYYVCQIYSKYSLDVDGMCSCFRCSNCFDCPSCGNTLSTRATSVQVSTTDQDGTPKSAAKKVFYLACGFCRWTSRDVGIPDQVTGQCHLLLLSLCASATGSRCVCHQWGIVSPPTAVTVCFCYRQQMCVSSVRHSVTTYCCHCVLLLLAADVCVCHQWGIVSRCHHLLLSLCASATGSRCVCVSSVRHSDTVSPPTVVTVCFCYWQQMCVCVISEA